MKMMLLDMLLMIVKALRRWRPAPALHGFRPVRVHPAPGPLQTPLLLSRDVAELRFSLSTQRSRFLR
jgi:hypothetical protein